MGLRVGDLGFRFEARHFKVLFGVAFEALGSRFEASGCRGGALFGNNLK